MVERNIGLTPWTGPDPWLVECCIRSSKNRGAKVACTALKGADVVNEGGVADNGQCRGQGRHAILPPSERLVRVCNPAKAGPLRPPVGPLPERTGSSGKRPRSHRGRIERVVREAW